MTDNLFDAAAIGSESLFDGAVEKDPSLLGSEPLPTPFSSNILAIAETPPSANFDADMAAIQARSDELKNLTSSGYETQARNRLAYEDRVSRIKALDGLAGPEGVTPELAQGIVVAQQSIYAEDSARLARVAAEKKAAENILSIAATDPTQARLLYNQFVFPSAAATISDYNTKLLVRAKEIDKVKIEVENQSWMADVVDYVIGSFLAQKNWGNLGNVTPEMVAEPINHWYDVIWGGGRVKKENEALNSMPAETYAEAFASILPLVQSNASTLGWTSNTAKLEILQNLDRFDDQQEMMVSGTAALDMASLATIVNPKTLVSIPSALMVGGARKNAAKALASAADEIAAKGSGTVAEATGVSHVAVQEEIELTALSVSRTSGTKKSSLLGGSSLSTPPLVKVPLTKEIDHYQSGADIVDSMFPRSTPQTPRLTDAETVAASEANQLQVETNIGWEAHDVAIRKEALPGGNYVNYNEFTFGDAQGKPFLSAPDALRAAGEAGFGNAEIVKDVAGGWFFKFRKDMPEYGFFTTPLDPTDTQGILGSIARKTLSNAVLGDDALMGAAVQSGAARASIVKTLEQNLSKALGALNAEGRSAVNQVLNLGITRERWWDDGELTQLFERGYGRVPTKVERDAYDAVRAAYDGDFTLRSAERYVSKSIRGYESVKMGGAKLPGIVDVDAKVAEIPKVAPRERVYNVSDNVHYSRDKNAMTTEELQRLRDNGYVHVTTEAPVKLADGTTVTEFVVRKSDIERNPLSKDQIGYAEGGTRAYKSDNFIKRAVTGTQPDTGKAFTKTPNTYATAPTRSAAIKAAETLEAARKAFVDSGETLTAVELDEQFFKGSFFMDGKRFLEDLAEHGSEHPFEAVYNRELPSFYTKIDDSVENYVDLDAPPGWSPNAVTRGRLYYSGKGTHLPDVKGALAPTVDAYEMLSRNLNNIANLTSFSNYKIESIERWLQSFKGSIDTSGLNSSYEQFKNARVVTSDARLANKIEAQREVIKRVLQFETPSAKGAKVLARQAREFVEDKLPGAAKAIDWVVESNPVMAARSLAFDLTLGMFNIGQFPIQISTAFAATAISPRYGMLGWASGLGLRAFTMKGGDQAFLDLLSKRGLWKTAGFKTEAEFKVYANALNDSGWLDIASNHLYINGGTGVNAHFNTIGNAVSRARDWGRMPFNEAEITNRIVAFRIGWGKAVDSGLKPTDTEFLKTVFRHANDMSFRMTNESAAYWQKGLWSIPTQFWAYSARNLEMLFGTTLSTAEKSRLMAFNTFIGGTAAWPFFTALNSYWESQDGHAAKIGSPMSYLTRGFLDNLIYATVGADVKVGKKYATQDIWTDIIGGLFGYSAYGEGKSFIDVTGGATLSILTKMADTSLKVPFYVGRYMIAANGADTGESLLLEDSLEDLARSIKSVGNGLKFAMALQYKSYYTKAGARLNGDEPTPNAFFYALGFGPGFQDELTANSAYLKNKKQAVKDATQILIGYRTELQDLDFYSPSFDQEYAKIEKKTNAFVRLLPPDVARQATQMAGRNTPTSLSEGLAKKMERAEEAEAQAVAADDADNEDGTNN